jgi:hypothetical protein
VGQAKRRHVLRYIAARERVGIVGTGPFDLDETLVRLEAELLKGCPWALKVATELALTRQQSECDYCQGTGTIESRGEAVQSFTGSVSWTSRRVPCSWCAGSGRNRDAMLKWPAWLRRKGQTMTRILAVVHGIGVTPSMSERLRSKSIGGWPAENGYMKSEGWRSPEFQATCESDGKRRRETRPRTFSRNLHRQLDPWQNVTEVKTAGPWSLCHRSRWPAWLRGDQVHNDLRRKRTMLADRRRRPSIGSEAHVRSAVLDVPGVTSVTIESVAPYAVEVTVAGGDDLDIGHAIASALPAAVATEGRTMVRVDGDGWSTNISFSRPR